MDDKVYQTQRWLNTTYKNKPGYSAIPDDGITGWGTMKALIIALQIELGIDSPNGVFGPSTTKKFNALCPIGVNSDKSKSNINHIIQGGLYCKGYNPGEFSDKFTDKTKAAIIQLLKDAGFSNPTGYVDVVIMKSLLSMDSFKLLNYGSYNGKTSVRKVQQYLNNKYYVNSKFATDVGLVPCDGIYGRTTNKALIYALQIEEGISTDGMWGPNTQKNCPTIPSSKATKNFIYLLQAALYCNNEDPNGLDGAFGGGVQKAVRHFQEFTALPSDGYVGPQTWASLLASTGDPLRKGTACDTSYRITDETAQTLIKNGRSYVGRYLTGKNRITPDEVDIIYKHGLKLVPLMQVLCEENYYFSSSSGIRDAMDAITVANLYGFSEGTVIYFCIDYDALTSDLANYIEPYFKSVKQVFNNSIANFKKLKIGVYAPRAICTLLANKGYTESSYVSDMSTLFSSNLGYTLPTNWSFDQIHEYTIGRGAGSIKIDNVIARPGHIKYCNSISPISVVNYNKLMKYINNTPLLKAIGVELSGAGPLVFVDQPGLKISLDVGTKFNIGDNSDTTFKINKFKLDGAEFRSELSELKGSLTADGAAELSKSVTICDSLEVSEKISCSADTIKIEIEADVDEHPEIYSFPLTITLCIEIKKDNSMSLSEQIQFIYKKLTVLSYNTAQGAIAIGKKVLTVIGWALVVVLCTYLLLHVAIPAIIGSAALTSIVGCSSVMIILIGLIKEIYNKN
ncbi:MAG: DUF1906 domain-containing protein [Clostridiaceae bacterium]|nr:DUF1906 domain-containing protein [Clostridiaceae bacterium]